MDKQSFKVERTKAMLHLLIGKTKLRLKKYKMLQIH